MTEAPEKICIDDTSLDEDGIYMASEPGKFLNIDVEYTRSDLVPQWRSDMENAPKDGTRILVVNRFDVVYIVEWSDAAEFGNFEVSQGWQVYECEDLYYSVTLGS